MSRGDVKWYWTDDLARILAGTGRNDPAIGRWLTEPVAIRGEGEALAVAEALLADEGEEVFLAA